MADIPDSPEVVFWPLASVLWNNAALQDLEIVLDFVGISAKAVEEVIVFHESPLGTVNGQ